MAPATPDPRNNTSNASDNFNFMADTLANSWGGCQPFPLPLWRSTAARVPNTVPAALGRGKPIQLSSLAHLLTHAAEEGTWGVETRARRGAERFWTRPQVVGAPALWGIYLENWRMPRTVLRHRRVGPKDS